MQRASSSVPQSRYVYAYSDHIGDRKEQQDRVAVLTHDRYPDVVFAVLADGMGGHTGGAIAAQCVIDAARQTFENYTPAAGAPEAWLKAVIARAHEAIQAKGEGFDRDPRSTVVMVLADESGFHWAHVGDSRLYRVASGEFAERTEDHSLVEVLLAQGQITEAQVATHPERSRLFSSLGGDEVPTVPYGEALHPHGQDYVLLCSDGLWAYFHKKEITDLTSYRTPDEACQRLIRLARKRAKASGGDGDNISVAVIRVAAPAVGKGLLAKIFGAKKQPPSNFEDARRYMRGALHAYFGPEGDDLLVRVDAAREPAQLKQVIAACAHAVTGLKGNSAGNVFAAKAAELMED